MYLVITNRGSMNRIALTLFGYSTKRDRMDDPTIIGNKGSGLKLAALAAMRLGLHVAVSSTDHCGRYFLSYEKEDVAYGPVTVEQIMLRWRELGSGVITETREPWHMGMEAFRDWDKPIGADDTREFKMFREYLANAYDEDKSLRMTLVDECSFAEPGETAVFIQWNEGLERILLHSACYFTFLGTSRPHVVIGAIGEIRGKSQTDATRLFVNGVMVECSKDSAMRSAFDYVLQDKTLISEERIIKDRSRFVRSLGSMLVEGVRQEEVARILLKAVFGGNCLEASAFYAAGKPSDEATTFWRGLLRVMVGKTDVCVGTGNATIDSDAEQLSAHVVLPSLPHEAKAFLERIGIPSAKDVVPTTKGEKAVAFDEIAPAHQELLLTEFRLLAKYFPAYALIPLRFYVDPKGTDPRLGYCKLGTEEPENALRVVPSEGGYVFPEPQSIRTELRHEPRHGWTQVNDYHRKFMNAAEREIDGLIARLEGHASLPDGEAILPAEDDPEARPTFCVVRDLPASDAGASFGPDPFEEPALKTPGELVHDLLELAKNDD